MVRLLIRFTALILVGLMTGTLCSIWVGLNPREFSFPIYLALQQQLISAFNMLMPLLGLIAISVTLWWAVLERQNRGTFIALMAAALLLIISGLITRLGNQPINDVVMTWTAGNAPDNWMAVRDKWFQLHKIRSLTMLLTFCTIIWATIKK
jgi:hypothetical protein